MSSLKSLYQKNKEGVTVSKYLKQSSPNSLGEGIESGAHLKSLKERQTYFLPPVDYSNPENFVRFGSAFQYYKNTFEYISSYYPYDGSGLEKTNFYNDINPLEKFMLEEKYPKSTGFVIIGSPYGFSLKNTSAYDYITDKQYINIKGGPHKTTKYDETKRRTSNLEFGGPSGSTVEFFLKKDSFIDQTTQSRKMVIFDLTNGVTTANSSSADYGRMRINLVSGSETQFFVTMLSGTNGFIETPVPSTPDQITISDGAWRNFSFVFKTDEQPPKIDFYVNGTCVETDIPPSASTGYDPSKAIGLVTGTMIGNIGALRAAPDGAASIMPAIEEGDGKFSGSVDEFRFWKNERNAENVGRYWFANVEGGSDKYDANVDLGVYFKFNEGITTTSSVDSVVLDYSGRISNGSFTGYIPACRNTGSAINQLQIESVSEPGDPIIRVANPRYTSSKYQYESTGSIYDRTNSSYLLNNLPNWVVEAEENSENEIVGLTQIISGYFDTLYNQLTALKKLKYNQYVSGTLSNSIDEFPFNDRLVDNYGIQAPELFENADVLSQFFKRDEQINFDQRLVDIKNSIYKNIYNNLNFILKSKGNEKSVRNFIRCLGVGEEILSFNTYSDNRDYELSSSYNSTVSTKKYIDFTALLNQTDNEATVYQYYDAANPNSVGLISGSNLLDQFAFTLQSEFVFPNKDLQDTLSYNMPQVVTSSLFGFHTPLITIPTSSNLTWTSAADDYGLQVYAIKSPAEYAEVVAPRYKVRDAYFVVKNRAGTTLLTSSVYRNVYDNSRWGFSLSLKPKKYPFSNGVLGSTVSSYELSLDGVNYESGIKQSVFNITTDLTYPTGSSTLRSAKRLYVGAHKTNYTGSTLESTDVKASSTRFWTDYLTQDNLSLQTKEVDTSGRIYPSRNAFLFQTGSVLNTSMQSYIPRIQTLALDWDFADVTGSDDAGMFDVSDASYGLNDGSYEAVYQKNPFSNINLRQHTGRGDGFTALATPARKQYVYADKLLPPDFTSTSDMVQSLSADDEVFQTFQKPVSSFFAIEKSMYRSISNRMLALFASIKEFNNFVGEPVNKYRLGYKRMEKMREIFFRKVQNDIADLQKYLDYYKWLDTAMTQMLDQLMPVSARYAPDVRNVVESHALERNKIQYKAPLLTTPGSMSRVNVIEGSVNGDPEEIGEPGGGVLPPQQPADPRPGNLGGNGINIAPGVLEGLGLSRVDININRFQQWIDNFDPEDLYSPDLPDLPDLG